MNQKYCLTLDLINDPQLIEEYEVYHKSVKPEILQSFTDAGIILMELYRWENRIFMIIEVEPGFSFERKAELDANNQIVQEWEKLMSNYQQRLPGSNGEGKWQLMKKIFES
ncbi:L-rhamnose mutarotase [Aquiflexum gelatinilyticum]|uniref:L-rhamnose mutarotase n=1 Tax=Aquiflexum gelatinilyticum TaxID=2961943 RepID=A0A9X2P8E3_9BACT|nr:L-rhamnose mutarotase [Aquiflexum gelatinilyticum]MCR9015645.1 L-rhamnose mutarotase [Aquiflexum gelatinilyticum]